MIRARYEDVKLCRKRPVNLKQKLNRLSQAYVFLNPIEWKEPFSILMIEAMALGCPVISFACGAAPEIVVHGSTGFLVHEMVQAIPKDRSNRPWDSVLACGTSFLGESDGRELSPHL